MPRTYKRKTQRQNWDPKCMELALDAILEGMPIKTSAKLYNVPLMSLKRRFKNINVTAKDNLKYLGSKRTVFTKRQEEELIQHVLHLEMTMYGITTNDLRRLAYQLAERNNFPHPFSHANMSAGKDWLYFFQRRHPEITLRKPESTSIARAQAFNKPVVTKFFGLLKELITQYKYPPHQIFNVDETSISTVPGRNSKTFAKTGRKQVSRITSAERGISSTGVICMSASGNFIPPMIIFNRKRMRAELMDGVPAGTIFACNESGWMKIDIFKEWFDHFVNLVKPSQDDPVLLIMDGHLSHTKNLDVILTAREKFVSLLVLPPHTTHKLQPLDVSLMFPLKTYLDQALETWLNNHPGRSVTTFQVSKIFCEAYLKATTPCNAINGFRKTGIVPFNPEIFSDTDFVAAEVTDQSNEGENSSATTGRLEEQNLESPTPDLPDSDLNCDVLEAESTSMDHSSSFSVPPEVCHPIPKMSSRRSSRKRRSCGTVILSSSTYTNELIKEKNDQISAEIKKKGTKKAKLIKSKDGGKNLKAIKLINRKKANYGHCSNDDTECMLCYELFSN
ncbi:uncharacterized protein [Prorops nasuta]|uniref:uncharacterized protein n=1 Tax=Prorops nasuta TaxID=863751 RepID=UPI0034CE2E73